MKQKTIKTRLFSWLLALVTIIGVMGPGSLAVSADETAGDGPKLADLKISTFNQTILNSNASSAAVPLDTEPAFTPENTTYNKTIYYNGNQPYYKNVLICPVAADADASIEVTTSATGYSYDFKDDTYGKYYQLSGLSKSGSTEGTQIPTTIKVTKDGKSTEYTLNITINRTKLTSSPAPALVNGSRTETAVNFKFTPNKKGTMYYKIDSAKTAIKKEVLIPDQDCQKYKFEAGENTVVIGGLTDEETYLHYFIIGEDGSMVSDSTTTTKAIKISAVQRATLSNIAVSFDETSSTNAGIITDYDSNVESYDAVFSNDTGYVWVTTPENTTVTMKAVSGVDGKEANTDIAVSGDSTLVADGTLHKYTIKLANEDNPAVVKLIAESSESGIYPKTYTLTISKAKAPVISGVATAVTERTEKTAQVTFTADTIATGYYLPATGDNIPDVNTIKTQGYAFETIAGLNTIDLENLTKDTTKVYMILCNKIFNELATGIQTVNVTPITTTEQAALTGLEVKYGSGSKNLLQNFAPETNEYNVTTGVNLASNQAVAYFYPTADENITYKIVDKDGTEIEGDNPKITFTPTSTSDTAVVKVIVSAHNKLDREYIINLKGDSRKVKMTLDDNPVTALRPDSLTVAIHASKEGTIYYGVNQAVTSAFGTSVGTAAVREGINYITISETSSTGKWYFFMKDEYGNEDASDPYIDIPAYVKGNIDCDLGSKVDINDAMLVVDMIRGTVEKDLVVADLDADEAITIWDAMAVVDIIRKTKAEPAA